MEPKLNNLRCLMLDLDGTLLGLPEQPFVENYQRLITAHFTDKLEPDFFLKAFWVGTESMIKHDNDSMLIIEAFFEAFYSVTGMSRDETIQRFDNFYHSDFQQLKQYSKIIPESQKLISIAKNKQLKVILATNPLYPKIAVQERCKWANLDFDSFFHVSHAENSTNCKPNPKYYSDLLKIADVQPDHALMVGNDCLYDMSAKSVGIRTWLTDKYRGNEEYQGKYEIDYEGSLTKLIQAISKL